MSYQGSDLRHWSSRDRPMNPSRRRDEGMQPPRRAAPLASPQRLRYRYGDMPDGRGPRNLHEIRLTVADRVRELRVGRRLTQRELALRLNLSQGRLSELERGDGSFTAEQLLLMLGLFNIAVSHFLPASPPDPGNELQNALARLGARHLHVVADLAPTERFDTLDAVLRQVLVTGAPRHLTALAPVLVEQLEKTSLPKLRADLAYAGLDRRFGWLLDNTRSAARLVHHGRGGSALTAPERKKYRRADVVLSAFLDFARPSESPKPIDLLDPSIASAKTQREIEEASSDISRQWGIVSDLQPTDFAEALRAAHAAL